MREKLGHLAQSDVLISIMPNSAPLGGHLSNPTLPHWALAEGRPLTGFDPLRQHSHQPEQVLHLYFTTILPLLYPYFTPILPLPLFYPYLPLFHPYFTPILPLLYRPVLAGGTTPAAPTVALTSVACKAPILLGCLAAPLETIYFHRNRCPTDPLSQYFESFDAE